METKSYLGIGKLTVDERQVDFVSLFAGRDGLRMR